MAELRKYGAATTILFPLIERGVLDFESTPASAFFTAADIQISKDEGAFANTDSIPVHEGNGMYSLALTATEMQAARIMITVITSSSGKTWEDQAIIVDTYGNASAQHALDLDTAIPDAVWDEPLTTSAHNGANSAGKRLRQASSQTAVEGAVSDAGATTTDFDTDLVEASDDHYNHQAMTFLTGNLAGQSKVIALYTGASKNVAFEDAWTEAPANGDEFVIQGIHIHPVSSIVDGVLTTQMTEAYAADGVAPTLAQALHMILQQAGEFSISGTTITVKKLDGSTVAATFTLDDGSNPTSRTRAT